jgi:hypothetical protein
MWRLIFLGLIIWLAVYFFKRYFSKVDSQKSGTEINEINDDSKSSQGIEDMVQCATCHVHLPRSEAFLVAGNFYCSHAHIPKK